MLGSEGVPFGRSRHSGLVPFHSLQRLLLLGGQRDDLKLHVSKSFCFQFFFSEKQHQSDG